LQSLLSSGLQIACVDVKHFLKDYNSHNVRAFYQHCVNGLEDEGASANIRLRWNYRPDSDLYIIYTAGQRFASLVAVNPPQYYENRFVIKFTYSWSP
jgi:hypothetical protein